MPMFRHNCAWISFDSVSLSWFLRCGCHACDYSHVWSMIGLSYLIWHMKFFFHSTIYHPCLTPWVVPPCVCYNRPLYVRYTALIHSYCALCTEHTYFNNILIQMHPCLFFSPSPRSFISEYFCFLLNHVGHEYHPRPCQFVCLMHSLI